MVFSTLEFLFLFFPIVLLGYVLVNFKKELGNLWLLLASLVFYYVGSKENFKLLIAVILLVYIYGLVITKVKSKGQKRLILGVTIGALLSVLIYYKYFNFLIHNINLIFHRNLEIRDIALPVGISFFIFQAISYIVDVYKGEKPLLNPIDMGLYIAFFPQLIAGPIVRFHDIREYLDKKYRKLDLNKATDGIWRFSIGLCKKVLIANNIGGLADLVFGVENIAELSVLYTWLGAVAYTLQIYYDFSGYSDMAIGLGKIFGFEFQENFNFPYAAHTIREFWHRWHISLSQFFRDYVYIPLGGNRCSTLRWVFNIIVVWSLTGLWHGASWTYILWGLSYGILLILERFVIDKLPSNKWISIARRILTMFAVVLLWVVFKCEDSTTLIRYLKNMFGIGAAGFIDSAFIFQFKNFAFLIFVSILFVFPIKNIFSKKVTDSTLYKVVTATILFIGVVSSVSYIYMGSYNPFLYFMF